MKNLCAKRGLRNHFDIFLSTAPWVATYSHDIVGITTHKDDLLVIWDSKRRLSVAAVDSQWLEGSDWDFAKLIKLAIIQHRLDAEQRTQKHLARNVAGTQKKLDYIRKLITKIRDLEGFDQVACQLINLEEVFVKAHYSDPVLDKARRLGLINANN